MNALPEIAAVREALRPTGEATDVIRELRHEIPPVVEVTVSAYDVIAQLTAQLAAARESAVRVFAKDDESEAQRQSVVHGLKASLDLVRTLRPATRRPEID